MTALQHSRMYITKRCERMEDMKTTILSDIETMLFMFYLIIDDRDMIAYVLFAFMAVTTVIKWITSKDGE